MTDYSPPTEPVVRTEFESFEDFDPRLRAISTLCGSAPELVKERPDARQIVPVLARLIDEGDAPPGLEIRVRNGSYVTGTIDLRDLAAVRRQVRGLKLATRCRAASPDWREEIGILPDGPLPLPDSPLGGDDVVVGVVDTDCAFAHPAFRDPETGKTRFLAFWDQRGDGHPRYPARYGYGREFIPSDLDDAIAAPDPYGRLGYGIGNPGAPHGTHVLALAAGSRGVARRAGLVFVHVAPEEKIVEPARGGLSLCDSHRLVEAVQFVFDVAKRLGRPAVVNVSLAGQAGPHDGSSLVEQHFDEMLRVPGRAIVLAAGNTRSVAQHAQILVPAGGRARLHWWVPQHDGSANELDMWYPGNAQLTVQVGFLETPVDEEPPEQIPEPIWTSTRPLRRGTFWKLFSSTGAGIHGTSHYRGSIHHRQRDSQNLDNEVFAYLVRTPTVETVSCILQFENQGEDDAQVEAWIDTDAKSKTAFIGTSREEGTVSGIATGERPIVVGGYRRVPGSGVASASRISSIGPTRRHGRSLPHLCALGEQVEVVSLDPDKDGTGQGTSVAAPQVAGVAALLLQSDPSMKCERVRELLTQGAAHATGTDTATMGAGLASLPGALRALHAAVAGLPQGGVSSAPPSQAADA